MKRRILIFAVLLLAATATVAVLVLRGTIQLNHPSRSEYPVQGVDVSHYQGEIDFEAIAEQNMQFAFIKATEGSSYVDEYFARNLERALNADLRVGCYHFFSYDSPGSAQAENFIRQVPDYDGMLPPVIDVEFYGDYVSEPPESESVWPELRAMADALEEHYGVRPIIYCTLKAYRLYIQDAFDDCDLWIRSVYWKPSLDREWMFWQYTDHARLEGYDGVEPYIDVNVYAGSVESFEKYPD